MEKVENPKRAGITVNFPPFFSTVPYGFTVEEDGAKVDKKGREKKEKRKAVIHRKIHVGTTVNPPGYPPAEVENGRVSS